MTKPHVTRFFSFLLSLCLALGIAAQQPEKVPAPNAEYSSPEKRANAAKRLGSANREQEQKPEALAAALGIKPGDKVADVGTGIGFMLPYLSRAVSPGGTVYAEDIFADLLDSAKERVRKLKLENVQFVLGDVKDPHLPAEEIDLVLMLDAYHHFEYPKAMLQNLRTALKPQGRIAIVDFYKRGGMQNHVRLDRDGVVKEVEGFGWKLDASPELLPNQYIVIFKPIEPLTR